LFPVLQDFHFRFCNISISDFAAPFSQPLISKRSGSEIGVLNDGYGGGSISRVTDGDILVGRAALLLLLRG